MHACTYTKVQQGYKSRVGTEHSFSFLQRSSKQGIVKENDPCEFFSSFVAEVAYVQFPFPLGTVGNHGGVPQVNPPVQLHSLLKIMDTKRRVSSKENIRLIASFIFTLPGLQLFYYICIPGTFVRQVVCLVVRVVYSCLAPNFQVQFPLLSCSSKCVTEIYRAHYGDAEEHKYGGRPEIMQTSGFSIATNSISSLRTSKLFP